jgi:hypothetical protein
VTFIFIYIKASWFLDHWAFIFLEVIMIKIAIREDALQVLNDTSLFHVNKQEKAAEAVLFGKTVAVYYIEIDVDGQNYLKSKGLKLNDIDQVSDFILSAVEHSN